MRASTGTLEPDRVPDPQQHGPVPPPVPARTTNGAPPPAPNITTALRIIITVAVMSATLLEVLDTSIVNVALPNMMGNLGATLDQIGWVSTGYIIANVIVLPLTGWLSDYFGRKKYLTYSVIVFTASSVMCGSSRTLAALVFWRIVQGSGGAAFISTAQATLMESYPPHRRGLAQALFGMGVVMAPTLGPTLGGYITDRYTWPFIFYINLPIGIVAGILTWLYVPNSASAGVRRAADFVGIGFLALGLGCLQTVLERGESDDWFSARYIVYLAAISAVALMLFGWWELRPNNKSPAVNLRIMLNRNLASGTLYATALGFCLYGGVFVMPQFLQNLQNHTAEQSGLILFPGGVATAMMMPVVGNLANRVDKRLLIAVGTCIFVSSMWLMNISLTTTAPDTAFFLPLVLRGAGIGLQFVPLSLVALGTLKGSQIAEGAGIYNLFRQLGGSFGIAILATILERRIHFHYARLSDHLTAANPALTLRVAQLQALMRHHGMAPAKAQLAAYKIIGGTVFSQASVMAYRDVFYVMSGVGVGALFLLLTFKKAASRPAEAPAVH